MSKHFVFDVESIGLHGEAFAVAFMAFEDTGLGSYTILEEKCYACSSTTARGDYDDHIWVQKHVPTLPINAGDPRQVRALFWAKLCKWGKDEGAAIWADHSWPVDVGIIHACIQDNPVERKFIGPNPVHDICTLSKYVLETRLSVRADETPQHDPRNDVKYSARVLQACLNKLNSK